jgi:hypothetical protein
MDVACAVSVGRIFSGHTRWLCCYLSLSACTIVFSAVVWYTVCFTPHHGFQTHFIAFSNIAKAWEVVSGVMYEWHQD